MDNNIDKMSKKISSIEQNITLYEDIHRNLLTIYAEAVRKYAEVARNPNATREERNAAKEERDTAKQEVAEMEEKITQLKNELEAAEAQLATLSPCDSFNIRISNRSSRSSSKNNAARRDEESTYFRGEPPTQEKIDAALADEEISVTSDLTRPPPEHLDWLKPVLQSPLFLAAFRVVCIRLHVSVSKEDLTTATTEYLQRLFVADAKKKNEDFYGVTFSRRPHPAFTLVANRHSAEMRITFLHEAAHFIRRWATNSTISTPRAAQLVEAEAGEILERVMFGGVLGQHKDSLDVIQARLDEMKFDNTTTGKLYLLDKTLNVSPGSSANGTTVLKKVSFA